MTRFYLYVLPALLAAQPATDWKTALDVALLDPDQALVEVYTASRVPLFPALADAATWDQQARALRGRLLDEIVFRGEATRWRAPDRKVEVARRHCRQWLTA